MSSGLDVRRLSVRYPLGGGLFGGARRSVAAVSDVSLRIAPGETVGVVGESGCGKSSFARALVRLAPISGGSVAWNGSDLTSLDESAYRRVRPEIQMVFQDPFASLNPRMRMRELIAEPLVTHMPHLSRAERDGRVAAVVRQVGLTMDMAGRFPHEFSGGQAQRIGIARAIILGPSLLICDEAVSSLDVSVQALILKLLKRLQGELDLAMLFISHDLAVVRHMSDRMVVLYLGRVMEEGPAESLLADPRHPYTRALRASVLPRRPEAAGQQPRPEIGDELPSPLAPPGGCPFHTRCPHVSTRCTIETPELRGVAPDRALACHHAEAIAASQLESRTKETL